MSRSEEFAAGSNRFHPNVLHYRDGGLGGIGESHSVVGMVPTHVIANYRHHEGDVNGEISRETVDRLRGDLRSGHGFENPLMLEYDHKTGWAYLGEGNHRLRAAEEEGVPEVPVRVVRSGYRPPMVKDIEGRGAPASHKPIPGTEHDPSYIPSDIHPGYMNLTGLRHEARSVHEEIHDLLGPNGWRT